MRSLVRSSTLIHEALTERFKELKLSNMDIIRDAKTLGVSLPAPAISRYMTKSNKYGLTENQILWLCVRYGISVSLTVKKIKYNETDCINRVKEVFGG